MKTMGSPMAALVVVGCVLSALPLLAQTDPLSTTNQQMQPNQPGRVQPQQASLRDSSGAPDDSPQVLKDKYFLRRAAEGGLARVQLGQLAGQQAGSPEVTELGQRIADGHQGWNASMETVADQIGVRLPRKLNRQDQEAYDRLKGLSGEAFDKEYLACMLRNHHEELRVYRIESQTTDDADLKQTVDEGARVLRENLGTVVRLARLNGVPLPRRGDHPPPPPAQ